MFDVPWVSPRPGSTRVLKGGPILGEHRSLERVYAALSLRPFRSDSALSAFDRMSMPLRFLLLACILVLAAPLWSQPRPQGRWTFRTYSSENGLENQNATVMLQDREGFLWVGTEGGLYRYDGQHFTFMVDTNGASLGEPRSLHQDSQGILWVGTLEGLFRREGTAFVPVTSGVPKGRIESIVNGPAGSIWISGPEGPFVLGEQDRAQPLPGWPGGDCSTLLADPQHSVIWLGGVQATSAGIASTVYRWENGQFTPMTWPSKHGERIWALRKDAKDRLWARSSTHLWVLAPGESAFKSRFPQLPPSSWPNLGLDADGSLWIGTNNGLARVDGQEQLTLYQQEILPLRAILVVFFDREGTLWLGAAGLYRRTGRGLMFLHSTEEGLPCAFIWNIKRDAEKRLWVGTTEGAQWWTPGKGWSRVPGLERHAIRTLVQGPDGCWYMAGNDGILFRWNPHQGRLDQWPVQVGVPTLRLFRILFDRQNQIFIGTETTGLVRAIPQGNGFRFMREPLPSGLSQIRVNDLAMDGEGRVLAATSAGLAVRDQGTWRLFTKADGLRSDQLAYLCPQANGELLAAYFEGKGVARIRVQGGSLQVLGHHDRSTGMMSQRVYAMTADAQGRLWFGTERGVDVVSPTGVDHFGISDGMPTEDFNAMAVLAEPEGDVWMGTAQGIIRFESGRYLGPPAPPRTHFFEGTLGSRSFIPMSQRPVEGSHTENTIRLNYGALSFSNERYLRYQVRLLGFEPEWRDTDIREIRYALLPPGAYQLEVKTRYGQGAWGPASKLGIVIHPAWFQTLWFRILVGILGTGLLGLVVSWRIRVLHQRAKSLEAQVAQRTRDLQEAKETAERASNFKSMFIASSSQDMSTPLDAILGFLRLMDQSELRDKDHRGYHHSIRGKAMAQFQVINDLIDLSRIEAGTLELDREPCRIRELVQEVVGRLSTRALEKGLILVADIDSEVPMTLEGDPQRLRQVLTTLLTRGLDSTSKGHVRCSLSCVESWEHQVTLRLEVEDTGEGLPPESMAHVFEAFSHSLGAADQAGSGLGLAITHHLSGMMGGSTGVSSEVGEGTRFHFSFQAKVLEGPPEDRPLLGQTVRILVEPAVLADSLEHHFRRAGATPTEGEAHWLAVQRMDRVPEGYPGQVLLAAAPHTSIRPPEPVRFLPVPFPKETFLATVLQTRDEGRPGDGSPSPQGRLQGAILVVEPRPSALVPMLEQMGLRPTRVATLSEAHRAVASSRFTWVVLDDELFGTDTLGAVRSFRAMPGSHDLSILAFSGSPKREDLRRAMKAGFDGYLLKPPMPEEVHRTLTRK